MRHLMMRVDRLDRSDPAGAISDRALGLAANLAIAFCLVLIAIGALGLGLHFGLSWVGG